MRNLPWKNNCLKNWLLIDWLLPRAFYLRWFPFNTCFARRLAASTKREAQGHVFVFFQKVDRLSVEIVFSKGLVRNSNYVEYTIVNYKRALEFAYIFWDSSRHQKYLQVYISYEAVLAKDIVHCLLYFQLHYQMYNLPS